MKHVTVIISAAVLLVGNAHAGFVGSFIGGASGAAMASNGTSAATRETVISSDQHDVIACCEMRQNTMCKSSTFDPITPEQFARAAGYSRVVKRGFMAREKGCDMIILEVTK